MKAAASPEGSIHTGNLILVNAAHPLRACPSRDALTPVGDGGVLLDRCAAALLEKLMNDICGWDGITAVSGWRSQEEQQAIWDGSLREHGADFTRRYVAVPGHSEHQTGLAIDLGLKKNAVDFLRPPFPDTGLSGVFRRRAARYGFIERYPAGGEGITGIAHEPWHFRYVGTPHAAVMAERGLTLEEYLAFLKDFPYGSQPFVYEEGQHRFEISFLAAGEAEALSRAKVSAFRMVSGNNVDGYILTNWRNGD